ncbi:MAG: hypothetical protein H6749_11045 [Nitrospiraceae bacterium]|nr:hypothetical protein [Nitrospiraceae bacterium]
MTFGGMTVVKAAESSAPIIVASGKSDEDHGKSGDDHGKSGEDHGKGDDHGKGKRKGTGKGALILSSFHKTPVSHRLTLWILPAVYKSGLRICRRPFSPSFVFATSNPSHSGPTLTTHYR